MARVCREYRINPAIRGKARDICETFANGDFISEARACFYFVRDSIRYLQDIRDVETLQTPDVTLQFRAGDCDDKALLLACLLESIGHPTRFVAVAYAAPGEFEHVFTETKIGDRWIACETIIDGFDFGAAPYYPDTEMVAQSLMREWV